MEMLADHFSLGVTTTALVVLRMLMVPLLLYNMFWSFKGFKQLIKGIPYPTSIYQSVVFMYSSGILAAQALIFAGKAVYDWSSPYVLLIQCAFFAGCLTAAYGRRLAITENFEKFYWLFNTGNMELASRVVHMADFDKDFTVRSIDAAETALAMKMVKQGMSNEPS